MSTLKEDKKYTSTIDSSEAFAVWVGCMGCYTHGRLNGKWVDARDAEDLAALNLAYQDINNVYWCNSCGADEFWVFDTDTSIESFRQEMSPTEAAELARGLDAAIEAGHNVEALNAWINYSGEKDLSDLSNFEDSYCGHYEGGLVEYAQEVAEDFAESRAVRNSYWPFNCIDWEAAAQQLDCYEEDGHVFRM
jgi:hypothetical protein